MSITGTDSGSANSLVTVTGVPAGAYLLIARTQLNSVSTTASEIVCEVSFGGKSSQAIANVGTGAGNSAHHVVTVTFNATTATAGNANLSCYRDTLTGTAPTASGAFIELLQVGTATSLIVSS